MHDSETLVVTDDARDEAGQLVFVSDENELESAVFIQRRGSRPHDDLGTEVAAHGIK